MMLKKLWLNVTLVAALTFISFTLQLERTTFAGAPFNVPPAYNRVKGPDLDGVLSAMFVEKAGGASAVVVAKCKRKEFVVGPLFYLSSQSDFTSATKTKADLEGRRYKADGAAPAGCYSKSGGETLLLYKVDRFDMHTDKAVVAKVKVIAIK